MSNVSDKEFRALVSLLDDNDDEVYVHVTDKLFSLGLEDNWIVVAEAIQTVLRREGFDKPYEALKNLTRTNLKIGEHEIHQFIDELDIKNEIKLELKKITPFNFTGI